MRKMQGSIMLQLDTLRENGLQTLLKIGAGGAGPEFTTTLLGGSKDEFVRMWNRIDTDGMPFAPPACRTACVRSVAPLPNLCRSKKLGWRGENSRRGARRCPPLVLLNDTSECRAGSCVLCSLGQAEWRRA